MAAPVQEGLAWDEGLLQPVPTWTRDPSIAPIERVCRQRMSIPSEEPCMVSFLAAGIFNKVYLVNASGRTAVMRVTLPVYPGHKTAAEVVTLRWVRENTSIPVPQVFAFDASTDNEIGFEWILMEHMKGTTAHKRWRTLSMEQKIALVEQAASFQLDLSGLGSSGSAFSGIGTLRQKDGQDAESKLCKDSVEPGILVSHDFFLGSRLKYPVERGPFRSSHDWLSSVLHIIIQEQLAVLETTDDKDDREEAEDIIPIARKLLKLLPTVFSPDVEVPEPTGFLHHDLNLNNFLLNEQGSITAVIDWECVSTAPIWLLSRHPKFLEEQVREEEPQRDRYGDETAEEAAEAAKRRRDRDCLDNEGKNSLYWIHLMEYEATQLQKVLKAKLKELCPGWPDEEPLKFDFYHAVMLCDGLWAGLSGRWAERLENGDFIRLLEA